MKALCSVLLCLLLCCTACEKKQDLSFGLPSDDPLAYVPGTSWAVVTEPIAVFREADTYESPARQPARRGDIFAVTGRRISMQKKPNGDTVTVVWYGFDNGWLEESMVAIYGNKMQAENAGRKLVER